MIRKLLNFLIPTKYINIEKDSGVEMEFSFEDLEPELVKAIIDEAHDWQEQWWVANIKFDEDETPRLSPRNPLYDEYIDTWELPTQEEFERRINMSWGEIFAEDVEWMEQSTGDEVV